MRQDVLQSTAANFMEQLIRGIDVTLGAVLSSANESSEAIAAVIDDSERLKNVHVQQGAVL